MLFNLDLRRVDVGEVIDLLRVGMEDRGGMLRENWLSFGGGNGTTDNRFIYPSDEYVWGASDFNMGRNGDCKASLRGGGLLLDRLGFAEADSGGPASGSRVDFPGNDFVRVLGEGGGVRSATVKGA